MIYFQIYTIYHVLGRTIKLVFSDNPDSYNTELFATFFNNNI